jgi:hypothetical protein
VLVKSGIIVDGTFVDIPKQQFSKEDYAQIKKEENPASHTCKPAVRSQKADSDTKIMTDDEMTDAAVYDSAPFLELVTDQAEKDENNENIDNLFFYRFCVQKIRRLIRSCNNAALIFKSMRKFIVTNH